ncbi:MAG: methionine--tRNA ligase subunit beta, partial [Pseudohongiellaceae bacterium]
MHTSAGFRTPTLITDNGYQSVNPEKMSKSRGTFIKASTYLTHLNPEYLRYYFAAKLGSAPDDLDLNLEDFVQRVNSDVVGKVINIASRCAGFINKGFGGSLAGRNAEAELTTQFQNAASEISRLYENRDFGKAMRLIMALADKANQYIADKQPWVLAKDDRQSPQVQDICSVGLNLFRLLVIYLKPVLPAMAKDVEAFLQIEPLQWSDAESLLTDHAIGPFKALMTRVEKDKVDAMVEDSKESMGNNEPKTDSPLSREPLATEIEFADFAKVDLRIVKIIDARHVEGADKLLQLELDLGLDAQGMQVTRTVFSGIKSAYDPESLKGKMTVMVANLKPRKMKFGISEGMILAAGDGKDIYLLQPFPGAEAGMKIT